MQDFDNFFGGTVHNHVRRDNEFPGSFHLSGAANAGEGCKLLNAVDNGLRNILGSGRVVLLDALYSGFELIRRFDSPPNLPHA